MDHDTIRGKVCQHGVLARVTTGKRRRMKSDGTWRETTQQFLDAMKIPPVKEMILTRRVKWLLYMIRRRECDAEVKYFFESQMTAAGQGVSHDQVGQPVKDPWLWKLKCELEGRGKTLNEVMEQRKRSSMSIQKLLKPGPCST